MASVATSLKTKTDMTKKTLPLGVVVHMKKVEDGEMEKPEEVE